MLNSWLRVVGTGGGHRGVSKEGFVNGDWEREMSKVGFANRCKGVHQSRVGKGGFAKRCWLIGVCEGRL